MRQDFAWRQPDATPDGLDLYLLAETDTRDLAQMVSCHQEIAADGAFGVGMLARFEPEDERGAPLQSDQVTGRADALWLRSGARMFRCSVKDALALWA